MYVFQAFTDALCHHVATVLACGLALTVAASCVVGVVPIGLIVGGLGAASVGLVALPLWRLLRGQVPNRQTVARQRSVEFVIASTCVGIATGLFLGLTGTLWPVVAATAAAATLLTAVSLLLASTVYKYAYKVVRYFDKGSITLDDPFWQYKLENAPHLLRAPYRGKAFLTHVAEARRDNPPEVTYEDWQLVRTVTASQIAQCPSLLDDVAMRQAVIDDPALAYVPQAVQKNKPLRAVLASLERCTLLDQWALAYLTAPGNATCRRQILQYNPWLPLLRFTNTSEDALDRLLANTMMPQYDELLVHIRTLLGNASIHEDGRRQALHRRPKIALMPNAAGQVLLQQVPDSGSARVATYQAIGHPATPAELLIETFARLPTLPRLTIDGRVQFLIDFVPITPDVNTPAKIALVMQATVDLMVKQPKLDAHWHALLQRRPQLATIPATGGIGLMDKFPNDSAISEAALQTLAQSPDNLPAVTIILQRYRPLTVKALAQSAGRSAMVGSGSILLDCMPVGTPAHKLVERLTVEHLASKEADKQRRIDVVRDRPALLECRVEKMTLFEFLEANQGMVNTSSAFRQAPDNFNALLHIRKEYRMRVEHQAWVAASTVRR